jgi:phage regulator Rha-like protein
MGEGLVPEQVIEPKIFMIRGQKVMLSIHLAELYAVQPKVLMQAVKRNIDRFPSDFIFQLSGKEADSLRSQIVTLENESDKLSKRGKYSKYLPYAFTEQGIAMLSSVLHSKRAVQVNITIMRAFVKLRQILSVNRKLASKLKELEYRIEKHDEHIQAIFNAIHKLMTPPPVKPKPRIGFHP